MKLALAILLSLFSLALFAQEQVLVANRNSVVESELSEKNIDEVARLLHTLKSAANLRCSLHVRQVKEVRKFLAGEKLVEMLEVEFNSDQDYGGIVMKTFFPVSSKYIRSMTNSEFSGPVEELKLESADRVDHWLTVQHDGRGHLVWAEMGDIFEVNPCRLRE